MKGYVPSAAVNRVALRACVQARNNERRDLACEGHETIGAACKSSPELTTEACEILKAIKFEFEPVDTIDK